MSREEHYLKQELYELVRSDPAIFEFLQAGSLDGIWYWDVERQDQEWMSPRFKELFGYRDDEIPNTSTWWQANIFPEDRNVALDNFAKHLADPNHPYDQIVRYRHRDGGTVWVRCRGLAVRNDRGEPIRLLGCHTDVTALKRAEEDLRRQTAELRDARDAAERANRAKSTFLANVSHEIRTPLNAVIGTAELLADTGLTPVQHDHLAAVRESAEALLDIINDILDYSKIEAGRLQSEQQPFQLRKRLDNLVKSLAPRLHGRPVTLSTDVAGDVPDTLLGDARLLRQVLANLLSNAIKFTARGTIELCVQAQESTGDTVTLRFEVADTGIGIPADKQRVIFEEFVQADASTTRRYGGTGLGLAIASRLVDALDGRIGLESEPGTGSTFHFTARFGRAAADAVEAPRDREPIVELRPLRVLLVEDSVANQRVATGMLEKAKHTVRVAADGAAAVEACGAERFDVVLMDLQMPRMDGYDATRTIRRREQEQGLARTPIVALTARASMGNEALCLSAGFDGYLPKPYRSRELLDAIAAQVGGTEPTAAPAAPDGGPTPDAHLDWDAALAAMDGDPELLAAVVEGFLGQHPSLVAELREALGTGDLAVVKRVAHTVGGSLRLFHDARVVALAHDLEERCHEGAPDQVAAAWRTLEPELAAVVIELQDRVGNQGQEGQESAP
ncbi:MAG: ATP-binding protein [Acidobacteria bacterium]|nr:ATP-binding protein [Acidobacteriota bacterium]